jgi:hypothetical protein
MTVAVVTLLAIAVAGPLYAQEQRVAVATSPRSSEAMPTDAQSEAAQQAAEKRRQIVREAVDALRETKNALVALEAGDTRAALDSLAKATGSLELVVARQPDLALAATDVMLRAYDVYARPEAVRAAVSRAEELLEDGRVQDARGLIEGLASEIVVSVENLPLATYPAAIRAITPLIDAGRVDEAKRRLEVALSTLVIVDTIVPLPVLRTEALLEDADMLAKKANRSAEENERLSNHLAAARTQLELGEALGYGRDEDFAPFYEELEMIEEQTANGRSGEGLFDEIRQQLSRVFG